MARTVEEITAQMKAEKALQSDLSGLDSPSQTAIWNLIFYVCAVCIAIFEQILDIRNAEVEALVAASKPSTSSYIKDRVLNLFQYDSSTPQTVILSDFAPTYAVIDETMRIVKRCAVNTVLPGIVEVKVAKEGPVALSGAEVTALQSFLDDILPAGVNYSVISDTADKIYVAGTVTYTGTYSPVIAANVKQALSDYYESLSTDVNFNGILRVSDVEKAIKSVEGVVDVVLSKVYGRADTTAFTSATKAYDLSLGVNAGFYQTFAGYCIEETTVGYTHDDSIVYVIGG